MCVSALLQTEEPSTPVTLIIMTVRRFSVCLFLTVAMAFNGMAQVEIAPMIKASWHQKSPFNDECPDGAATGCGAVAVAQILNYYKRPVHGFGRATYNSEDVDFEANPIDWDNIRDVYGNANTVTERAAVARLVHQTGVAMKMQYGSSSSPATHASMMWGLQHYLHFSPLSRYRRRLYYSTEEWLRMLDGELVAGHPVYYRGDHSTFEAKLAGHIFAIDGRDADGRYHFNFGHANSTQDKYASLNIVNQGVENFIGRRTNGNDNVAYDYRQAMVTEFYPIDDLTDGDFDAFNIVLTTPMMIDGDKTPRTWSTAGPINMTFQFRYVSFVAGSIYYSIGFYQDGDLKAVSASAYKTGFSDGGRAINADHQFALPPNLPDGNYEMAVVSRPDDNALWLRGWDCTPNSIPVTVTNGKFTFNIPNFHDGVTYLRLAAKPTMVSDGVMEFTVVNPSNNNFEGTIKVEGKDCVNKLLTAVYDGQNVTYRFPVSGKSIDSVSIMYLADNSDQWLPLVYREPIAGDFNDDGNVNVGDIKEHSGTDPFVLEESNNTTEPVPLCFRRLRTESPQAANWQSDHTD